MTIELSVKRINLVANQDLSSSDLTNVGVLHKAVTVNGTIAPTAALAAGFLKSKGKSGESVAVAIEGVVKVWAGAAISTVGYPVTITTSGFVIASVNCGYTIGKAFATANSGDLVPILCDVANLGVFMG